MNKRDIYLLFFALALFSVRYVIYDKSPDPILSAAVGKVQITGIISEDPDVRTDKDLITLRVETVNGKKISNESKILVTTGLFPQYSYGEEISVTGKMTLPTNFSEDSGGVFDYVTYLAKDRIYFLMSEPKIEIIGQNFGNPIFSALYSIKHAFTKSINNVLSEPQSSLMNGILLGERHQIDKSILDEFRTVGIIHIVILSGYAITIVAESVRKFFSRFGFRLSIICASVAIISFAIMTGGTAPVVRASIMALLAFLSRATARKQNAVRALFVAIFVMILWNPLILFYDVSFQISVIATLGLIFISPIFEEKIKWITEKFGFRSIIISSLSAQLAVFPYLLYTVGSFSIFSLPANILVLPFVPMTMFFGLVSGLIGFISTILAFPFSFIAYALTSYELFVANFFSSIPFSTVSVALPFWIVALIYLLAAIKLFSMTSQLRLAKKSST